LLRDLCGYYVTFTHGALPNRYAFNTTFGECSKDLAVTLSISIDLCVPKASIR